MNKFSSKLDQNWWSYEQNRYAHTWEYAANYIVFSLINYQYEILNEKTNFI